MNKHNLNYHYRWRIYTRCTWEMLQSF